MNRKQKITLPVGYYQFHKNSFINYQLNRWYSLAYARKEDIGAVGKKIRSFDDYVREFTAAAETAISENRLKNAATYVRASEFLIEPGSPNKMPVYNRFIEIFDRAFAEDGFVRVKVPFKGSFLSVIKLPARQEKARGTILAFGGFDSFIEEFYCMWDYFAGEGFEVIAFEGPGQGGTLRKYNLPFDHDWEIPVGAILDYFNINEATLIGVSMGGYWAIRAAAYEKRIKQLVCFPPLYDWLELAGSLSKGLLSLMQKMPGLMNFSIKMKMKAKAIDHTMKQAMFISGKTELTEAVNWLLGMNKEHISSHLVNQDVLLLTGESDAFQPPKLLYKQKEALINARSVSTRIFTKAEQADQHCQIGNVGLALETINHWLTGKLTG